MMMRSNRGCEGCQSDCYLPYLTSMAETKSSSLPLRRMIDLRKNLQNIRKDQSISPRQSRSLHSLRVTIVRFDKHGEQGCIDLLLRT